VLHSNEHSIDSHGTLLLLYVSLNLFTESLPINGCTCYNTVDFNDICVLCHALIFG
jgi:hypothetical protein